MAARELERPLEAAQAPSGPIPLQPPPAVGPANPAVSQLPGAAVRSHRAVQPGPAAAQGSGGCEAAPAAPSPGSAAREAVSRLRSGRPAALCLPGTGQARPWGPCSWLPPSPEVGGCAPQPVGSGGWVAVLSRLGTPWSPGGLRTLSLGALEPVVCFLPKSAAAGLSRAELSAEPLLLPWHFCFHVFYSAAELKFLISAPSMAPRG